MDLVAYLRTVESKIIHKISKPKKKNSIVFPPNLCDRVIFLVSWFFCAREIVYQISSALHNDLAPLSRSFCLFLLRSDESNLCPKQAFLGEYNKHPPFLWPFLLHSMRVIYIRVSACLSSGRKHIKSSIQDVSSCWDNDARPATW